MKTSMKMNGFLRSRTKIKSLPYSELSFRPYAKKQKFKRRASLPVIQAPQRYSYQKGSFIIFSLIENMENGFIPHQAPPASKPRAIRASVIISNPAHRPQVTQASPNILPTTVAEESKSRSWDNLASINDDGADSDGSGTSTGPCGDSCAFTG